MCFRRTQRDGREIVSESVLNGEETEECFPVTVPSSALDPSSSLLARVAVEPRPELCIYPLGDTTSSVLTTSKPSCSCRTWCLQCDTMTLQRLQRVHYEPLSSSCTALPLDLRYPHQAHLLLSSVTDWDFNIFTLNTLTYGRPLLYITLYLFQQYNFIQFFHLDLVKLMHLLSLIEDGYHRSNPYHNSVHAADVTQAMNCFLQESVLMTALSPLERLCSILAAASHDVDHPGVNQSFLIATNNPLVTLYQGVSVLENHHWRSLMCLIHLSHVFDHLDTSSWAKLEWQTRTQILATDITRQQDILRKFKEYIEGGTLDIKHSETDRNFALQIALKCADISNPCRVWPLSQRWGQLVCQEFFLQGDDERRLNLPVTKGFDRYLSTVVQVQTGFISYVVDPLFSEWKRLVESTLSYQLLDNLRVNLSHWRSIEDMTVAITTADSSDDSTPTPSTGETQPNFVLPSVELSAPDATDDSNVAEGNDASAPSADDSTMTSQQLSNDSLRRGSLPSPFNLSTTEESGPRRNSMPPTISGNQSSTMRRCLLLTSLAENPPILVEIISPDTPCPSGEHPSPTHSDDSQIQTIAQFDDRDTTGLLLSNCTRRRGSAPAACVAPTFNNNTLVHKLLPWSSRRSSQPKASQSASFVVMENSSSSWKRSPNVIHPADRRVVYMVAEGIGVQTVATVTGNQMNKISTMTWSRGKRRSNSAHAVIFRPCFVAGRRCSSPAIGNKTRMQWLFPDATNNDEHFNNSGMPLTGHTSSFTPDSDVPIVCQT